MPVMQPSSIGEVSSIAEAVLENARQTPDRLAFRNLRPRPSGLQADVDQSFGWGQIARWVESAIHEIESQRLPSGAHVASVCPNSVQWFVLDFACQLLGFVHVAIDVRWPPAMISRLLMQSDTRLLVSTLPSLEFDDELPRMQLTIDFQSNAISQANLGRLLDRASSISPDAAAQMLFTSGTSGEPRGVLLSNRNLVSNAFAKLEAAPQLESDRRLNILPFCHAYARTCELSTWVLSRSELAIASDWNAFLDFAKQYRPTLVNLVPHLVNKLLQHNEQTDTPENLRENPAQKLGGHVRLLQVGGAALQDAQWHALARYGLPPLQGYGLTEASPVVCSNRAGQQRPGTVGAAVRGTELKTDANQQLWIRGPNVMLGYYRDPKATQARIQNGWLATGDLVKQESNGDYRVVGRTSSVIVLSTGFKVSPERIEATLADSPWIERILLVGRSQSSLAAVVWPAWDAIPAEFFDGDSQDGDSQDRAALNFATFTVTLAEDFAERLKELPAFMQPRRFVIEESDMDAASGLLNAKGMLRRGVIEERLAERIKAVYSLPATQYFKSSGEY